MQDRPTATELLATLGEFVDQDVLPNVQGALRYRALVAANLIAVLQREIEAGDAPARRERNDLAALLGEPVTADGDCSDLASLRADVARLTAALQERLLGDPAPDRAFVLAARDVLERSVLDTLAVNKPGYARYDMAVEVG